MKQRAISIGISALAFLAIFYPVYVWWHAETFTLNASLIGTVFPVLGLIAFAVMWLHLVSWPFCTTLETYVPLKRFNETSSALVLTLIILHPLLFAMSIGFPNLAGIFLSKGSLYLWLGIIGFVMLVTYDIEKYFRDRDFFMRHKKIIDVVSTLGFFMILFHSLSLGGDLQTGTLRYVWVFYGITAGVAVVTEYRKEFFNTGR